MPNLTWLEKADMFSTVRSCVRSINRGVGGPMRRGGEVGSQEMHVWKSYSGDAVGRLTLSANDRIKSCLSVWPTPLSSDAVQGWVHAVIVATSRYPSAVMRIVAPETRVVGPNPLVTGTLFLCFRNKIQGFRYGT